MPPVTIAAGTPAYLALPGSPWCKLSCHLLMRSPLGQSSQRLEKPWVSEVAQLCPTLCDPMDCSPPGSSIHGILHARILEWVAISFSRGSSWPRDRTQVSCIAGRRFNLWATREAQKNPKSTIFPAVLDSGSPEYLRLPGLLRSKQLHHLHTESSLGKIQFLQGSLGSKPLGMTHAEVEIKPQLKPRGSVAKKKNPKPSHQWYKLQIKSTKSTRQILCLWNIEKVNETSKRKHTSIGSYRQCRQEHAIGGPN